MIPRLLIAGLLLGHALIHASYLAPRPPATAGGPAWPFELQRSWLLDSLGAPTDVTRLVGIALIALTIGGFAMAAIGAVGAGPAVLWQAGIVVGAIASLGVLVLFFHPWLTLGLIIDVVLLWAALVARWSPEVLAS
jgi:hypothetical protein